MLGIPSKTFSKLSCLFYRQDYGYKRDHHQCDQMVNLFFHYMAFQLAQNNTKFAKVLQNFAKYL